MRAETITFDDVFSVDVSSGSITLGNRRYVMTDAEALGNLRRELVDNLGWEVARGILERVAYQSGRDDARQVRQSYPSLSDEEWLRAGPRLHYLQGMAQVSLTRFSVNRTAGTFYMAGEWLGSYEADQHIKHYGIGNRPVCWNLEGYATGYASEFFGREVLCFETACRGKGDSGCTFELRPAEEWGSAALAVREMLLAVRFTERFDRCLRSIAEMGCELERSSLDAIVTTDARGVITSCSEGGADLLGLLPGEAVGREASSFLSGGAAEGRQIFHMLEKEGRVRNHLTEVVTGSGRKIPIVLAASALGRTDGRIVGIIGVAHNLSDIRRLEDELATKNRFMANILQDSADAIITMDPNDIITAWNRGAEAIFGYSANEVVGKSINIIIPHELKEAKELALITERLLAHGAVRSYQTERITKDGKRIQVIFTRTAIRDDSGVVIGSSAVLKDVTVFRSLERQLADAEHLATLGELSAGLAHEIKNPLAGIKGAIDVIRDSLPVSDMHREILGDVLHEVGRIDKIVLDLLNYAKPKPPCLGDVFLSELVQRIVAFVRQSSTNDSVYMTVTELTPVPAFTGDEVQLEQVLLNLLLNAQNAMPSGGNIAVRLGFERDEAQIRIEVEDDGPGIPEEIRKKIFQPFFTTRTDGTGLGLATCLKNVQYHGGSIDVRSELGRGTTFVVTLPVLSRL